MNICRFPFNWQIKFKSWIHQFSQDFILFSYLNQTFWKKVRAYGLSRMKRDVNRLLSDADNLRKSHLLNKNIESSAEFNVRNESSLNSPNLNEMEFEKLSWEVKVQNLKGIVNKNPQSSEERKQLITELAEYMVENHGWCPYYE